MRISFSRPIFCLSVLLVALSGAPSLAKPPLVYKGPIKGTSQKPLPPMPHITQKPLPPMPHIVQHEKRVAKAVLPSQPIEPVESGEKSGIRLFQAVVLQNEADLNLLWSRHKPGHPAPDIDFSKYTVLAIFDGQKNRIGDKVEITSVRKTESGANVTYRVTSIAAVKPTALVTAQPYQIVKTAKVNGSIAFARE